MGATAEEKYIAHQADVNTLLIAIKAKVDFFSEGDDIHWGHVGSMAHVKSELKDILDALNS